jgi:hypothetical protein
MKTFSKSLRAIISSISSADTAALENLKFSDQELLRFIKGIIDDELSQLNRYRGHQKPQEDIEIDPDVEYCSSIEELADMLLDDSNNQPLSTLTPMQTEEAIIIAILNLRNRKLLAKKLWKAGIRANQEMFPFAKYKIL